MTERQDDQAWDDLVSRFSAMYPGYEQALKRRRKRRPSALIGDEGVAPGDAEDLNKADLAAHLIRRTRRQAPIDGRYLYIGCGGGVAIQAIQLAFPKSKWVGVDASPESLANASTRSINAQFAVLPAQPPLSDFADQSFDGVIALDLFESIELDTARDWINEVYRLVKPDGFFIVTLPGHGRIAHLAQCRALPARVLSAAFEELSEKGTVRLAGASEEPETSLFASTWFIDKFFADGWRPRIRWPGVGPQQADALVFLRRPIPRSKNNYDKEVTLKGVRRARDGTPSPHRFVIIADQRTGSNMLVSALNSHPSIFCHGELFRRAAGMFAGGLKVVRLLDDKYHSSNYRHHHAEEFLEAVFELDYDANWVGFKLMVSQNPEMRDHLIADQRYAKVLLYRENDLACYSSSLIAQITGQGRVGSRAKVRTAKAEFKPRRFERFREQRTRLYADTRAQLKASGQPYLEMSYLDLCEPEGLPTVVAAIGADPSVAIGTRTQKRNPSDILARFSNPDVVEGWLHKHGLEHWRFEQKT